jgi:hypothetical protein
MATDGDGHSGLFQALVDLSLGHQPGPEYWRVELTPGQRYVAASTYFLLGVYNDDGRPISSWGDGFEAHSVEYFITQTLTQLVRQLSRRTERRQVAYRGQARGRILWPATYKARFSGDNDETLFVCRQVQRLYDTPENQLLKYVVEQLADCLAQVPASIRAGSCYRPDVLGGRFVPSGPRVTLIESALRLLRQHAVLRQVTPPERIDDSHILSAETARLVEYADVARFYEAFRAAVLDCGWEQMTRFGRQIMPLPQHPSPGDPWLRLGAAIMRS